MSTPDARDGTQPRIAVLLATRNGERWLDEQLETVLNQTNVAVRVIVSDDASTDSTRSIIEELAARDPRIELLPAAPASGSSAANFYRLIRDARVGDDELVAFADQDDVWVPGKLARHATLLAEGSDGVSSNVVTFSADGGSTLIRKDFPQRSHDFLLESPGPGSTFLLSPKLFALVREVLVSTPEAIEIDYHDWLIYAVARSAGLTWTIDSEPSVRYRQHDDNAMGANVGAGSALSRLKLIRQRWHRGQSTRLARIGVTVADGKCREDLASLLDLFDGGGLGRRWRLATRAGELRRRPRDQWIIGLLIATGVW